VSITDLPLLISLVFGAAQCLFGVAVIAYGTRAGRWRRTGLFLLMVLGAWALCSGAAELLVSGMAVAHRFSGMPSATTEDAVRRAADTALVLVSVALLVPLAAFSVWRRVQVGSMASHESAGRKD
jgi:hypothetical protein